MSGIFSITGNSVSGLYSHTIDQSLRFSDGDVGYLSRTFGTPTDSNRWTLSIWVKSCGTGVRFLDAGGTAGSEDLLGIGSAGFEQLYFSKRTSSSYDYRLQTTQLLRDPSAWYHCVVVFDSSNATSSDRQIIYINGERVTDFAYSSYPSSGAASRINTAVEHRIGTTVYTNTNLDNDGYIADMAFVDGQALTPTSFGETKAGIWIPKDTSGLTFGNNGFRLQFQDSSSIGDDTSGNGNDFSVTTLVATDVMPDSPTNNFATFNSLSGPNFYGTAGPYSHGNLHMRADNTVSSYLGADSTIGVSSGKWYWEIRAGSNGSSFYPGIGIRSPSGGGSIVHYRTQTQAYINGTPSGQTLSTYTGGDIIGVALDLDSGTNTLQFYKNGSANGSTFSLTSGHEWLSLTGNRYHSSTSANFGADSSFFSILTRQGNTDDNGIGDFYYSPPSGFLALCSANLPDPAIDPAQDEEPADYFNAVIYTGNGTADRAIDVGFATDFFWVKQRSSTNSHQLTDSVRGALKGLHSNSTNVENTFDSVRSFTSTGVTVGTSATTNANAATYVAWNWLAGGSAVTNNEGSITSSVSANTKAGFSIVSYTGDGSTSTVGHGLSNAPELSIFKNRDDTDDWAVSTTAIDGSHDLLYLNLTSAKANITVTAPTSSVFTVNNSPVWNQSGEDYIAYCFHSVDGYSKVGTYTGNGSTNGRFIYTGFRPAWLLVKVTSVTNRWVLFDSARSVNNPVEEAQELNPNDNSAEGSSGTDCFDFMSSGFKLRRTGDVFNTSGYNYIYLAFAEQPFKYANAR